jgi:putative ABC transport system substrate-binding protein
MHLHQLKRREFITLLGGAAAWPLAARAQQQAMPVIGFLNGASPGSFASRLQAFREGLGSIGYHEGRNVNVEYRWGEGYYERLSALAADLVRREASVIVATGTTEALTAKAATTTIPIVFAVATDPVELELVAALNRPGGNLTGGTVLAVEVGPKKLELLHELVPKAGIVALIVNPANRNAEAQAKELKAAALTLGVEIHVLNASTEYELETAFAALTQLRAGAVVIGTDPLFTSRSQQLAGLTLRYAVPSVFQYRDFAAAGGLMSYGGSFTESYRLAGTYAGRILKGEKPAGLPVQRYAKLELIINLKTAKALGLTVPLPLLGRADEVIE